MLPEILIIDNPFIWLASMNKSNTVIGLSKGFNQQYFLIGDCPESLVEYYQKIDEVEVRRINLVSKTAPFSRFDDMSLLFINLN